MNTDHSPPTLIHPLDKNTQRRDVEPEIQEIEPDNTGAKPTTITAESIKSSTLPPIQRQSTIPSIMTVNLGELDRDEQDILEADIKARKKSRRKASKYDEDDRVIIGTRVSEGHRNYQLMYDMLTGIRIAVGRVSAKMQKELVKDDFSAAHKLVFDITGNELTPGVMYDFKFKDYAPWVFRYLREKFHIDSADYMMSLTSKYILSEMGSPGKSGSFLYYSRDYRFIIKTIHHNEHKFMRQILDRYYEHVCQNPSTLLCRFYGLHRIKLPRGSKIHFVVMGNVFPANKDIHESFDLKGSTVGRLTSQEEIFRNPQAVLKDLNWIELGRHLEFGPLKRAMFLEQLNRDVKLLMKLEIMDYSLLVGIHDLKRGNRECIRDNQLQFVQPETKEVRRTLTKRDRRESKADIVRQAIKNTNPVQLDSSKLPDNPSDERRYCLFYSEHGGYQSSDDHNEPSDNVYFLGVIDILTRYSLTKRTEHALKSMTQDRNLISAVNPVAYGKRFLRFMEQVVLNDDPDEPKKKK